MHLAELYPPAGVSIRCGEVELRWMTDADLADLVAVAQAGVHGPDLMPFGVAWTSEPDATFARSLLQYHWLERTLISAQDWRLNFGTFYRGRLVGSQSISARKFAPLRTCSTGSWLGLAHQGQGIGTLQRQMVLALAFDHLGAIECRSGAFTDNHASLAVSKKAGYQITDTTREPRSDEQGWQTHHTLVVTPETFVRPKDPVEVNGSAAFADFLGL